MPLPFHPYADIFPLIEGEAFAELVADVKANDLRERIVVWDGKILDGRNRYRAALAAGLLDESDGADRAKYFVRFVPDVDGDPLKFVWSKNFHRRHLQKSQIAFIIAEFETIRHGGARKRPESQDANLQLESPTPVPAGVAETRAEMAEEGGVSQRLVASAAVVRDRGIDELKTAVRQGDIVASKAEQIARLPEPEQPAALAKALPNGHRAIMGSRQEPDDSLDYFPTGPWATRSLIEIVLPHLGIDGIKGACEPACGEGHMAEVIREYCDNVWATDIFDYGYGDGIEDFLDPKQDRCPDWIITNPPFGDKAEAFVLKAINLARVGVAMFFRLQWLESGGRYERIFSKHPPRIIAQFAERVPLHKGRWEPDGATATAYLWIVWLPKLPLAQTEFFWIPPGQRNALTKPDDAARFTAHPIIKKQALTGEISEAAE